MTQPYDRHPAPGDRDGGDWIIAWRVWHVRARRYIYRRDGKPFRFKVKRRR